MIFLFDQPGQQIRLTPNKLNQEIKRLNKILQDSKITKVLSKDIEIFFDFSKIEWVNTSSLVEFILIVESLLEEGYFVTIALPNRNKLKKEIDALKENQSLVPFITSAINKRQIVRSWLYRLKFIRALSFEHKPIYKSRIKILDIFDKEVFNNPKGHEASDYYKIHNSLDAEQLKEGEIYHIPLLWIDDSGKHIEYINSILKSKLDEIHVNAISDIIIKELTKNIIDHSQKYYGLFCAVIQKYKPKYISDYTPSENEFFNSCIFGENIAEIFFGDSGIGLLKTLSQTNQGKSGSQLIKYSFDKWSSRYKYENLNSYLDRGTRGLYHIRRIVQIYDGIITVKTGQYIGGFNELLKLDIDSSGLPNFNGTLLSIRLLPDRSSRIETRYNPTNLTLSASNSNFERLTIRLDNLNEGLKNIGENSIKNSSLNHLISLEFGDYENSNSPNQVDIALRHLLSCLSNLRHPNIHIVYGFPINFTATRIENIIDGVNEFTKLNSTKNAYIIYDPIMIIGPKGSVHWAGVKDDKLIQLLNDLMIEKEILLPLNNYSTSLLEYIKSDTGLFNTDGDKLKLNFNSRAPINYFKHKLTIEINNLIKQSNKVFITPNLCLVKGWLNIDEIYKTDKNEFSLALYSLWKDNRAKILKNVFPNLMNGNPNTKYTSFENLENIQSTALNDNLKVLVESNSDIILGQMFLKLLNIDVNYKLKVLSDEIDVKRPRRNPLFEKVDFVIIISSIVSTKETAINLIKSVLRSGATPICFLSIVDFYKYKDGDNPEIINVWGNEISYYSLLYDSKLKEESTNKEYLCISPIDNKIESLSSNLNYTINESLRELILKSESLHFSHIGKTNSRHFTFYFSSERFITLVNSKVLWLFFKPIIKQWYKSLVTLEIKNTIITNLSLSKFDNIKKAYNNININETSIWSPSQEVKTGYPGHKLSKIIQEGIINTFNYIPKVEPTSRGEEVLKDQVIYPTKVKNKIIVDWGSITGESIEKLIYKAHRNGYKNILVCIFLNQLAPLRKSYLSSLSEISSNFISYSQENYIDSKQTSLYDKAEFKSFTSNIKINFLFDFPLTCSESSYECNVCEIRNDLLKYEIPEVSLEKYAIQKRNYLDIRPRETTNDLPQDFYSIGGIEEKIYLSQEFILRMFEFKTLLINAENSTYWRLVTKQELINILIHTINSQDISRINNNCDNEIIIWESIIANCNNIIKEYGDIKIGLYPNRDINDFNIDIYSSRSHAIIYFLSIETNWIQKYPLLNNEIRSILTLIAKAIIFNNKIKIKKDSNTKDIDAVRIKYAAISVLRMTDKSEFAQHIYDIFNNTQINDGPSNSIIENLLFHTNTFISKEYHANHQQLNPIEFQLNNIKRNIKPNDRMYPIIRDAIWSLTLNLNNLIIKGQIRKLKKSQIVENCKEIIETGIDKFKYDHNELIQAFSDLQIVHVYTIDELDSSTDYFLNTYEKNWLYVSGFIKNIFGVHFSEIRSVLSSEWAVMKGSSDLSMYLFINNFGINDPFSLLINQIKNSLLQCLTQQIFIDTYIVGYNKIKDLFISHPRFNERKSTILELLDGLKGLLITSINQYTLKYAGQIKIINNVQTNLSVFYPQVTLDALIDHIFKNANEKRISEMIPEIFINLVADTDEFVEIDFINKNTDKEKKGKGTGLLKHKDNLPRFFGNLNFHSTNTGDFIVHVKFLKYV